MTLKNPPALKSFLKWPGSKRLQISSLLEHFPETIPRYEEPFLGSGVVLLNLLEQKRLENWIVASDTNEDIINLFLMAKYCPRRLYRRVMYYRETHRGKDGFHVVRDLFNQEPEDTLDRAAMFLYLNKTSYRGIVQCSSSGDLNSSYGYYKNPRIVKLTHLLHISKLIQNVFFVCRDYTGVNPNNFVYFDPPYVGSPFQYNQQFDHQKLADFVKTCRSFVMSNSSDAADMYRFGSVPIRTRRLINQTDAEEIIIKNILI